MSGRGRGRGSFYKAKYGGRGGNRREQGVQAPRPAPPSINDENGLRDWNRLTADLTQLDNQTYGAYKRLLGRYAHTEYPQFALAIDHVQGDAYAAPSRVRVIMPVEVTGFPAWMLVKESRRISLCDFITRAAAAKIRSEQMNKNVESSRGGWSGPRGGAFNINAPGQQVLPRTSCLMTGSEEGFHHAAGFVELRFTVSLPAAGRTILAAEAKQMLAVNLVKVVKASMVFLNLDPEKLEQHISSVERQQFLRKTLQSMGAIAFIANGSLLPRASGASDAPMGNDAIPFQSPPELETTVETPDGVTIRGMYIPRGIVVLAGGGFHGKSTLLEAIQLGIYDVIPGDGREGVVSEPNAVKIRAEDGRSINGVDLTPFLSELPVPGKDTAAFVTGDASGSTSMAANIQEALEAGATTLLIDEDSSATNLLVRDDRMLLLAPEEPIMPLVSKARSLLNTHKTAIVIVVGALGDWLNVADTVIVMDTFMPSDRTTEANEIVEERRRVVLEDRVYGWKPYRSLRVSLTAFRNPYAISKRFICIKPQEQDVVDDPAEEAVGVDLRGVEQLVEIGQARAIASIIKRMADCGIQELMGNWLRHLENGRYVGLEKFCATDTQGGDWVAVRAIEAAAAISRLRASLLQVEAR